MTSVRDIHRQVRAAYVSVQHTLTVDQRRDMRTRMATLSSLVRRAAILASVSHATEHAPALAYAASIHSTEKLRS